MLHDKSVKLEKARQELERKLKEESKKIKELEQEKIILEEISKSSKKKEVRTHKRFYILITLIVVLTSVAFAGYSYYQNQVLVSTVSHLLVNYNSNYLIQNLKGDVIDTWVAWNLVNGQVLHITIKNDAKLSADKIDAVKDAILSTQTVTLDDSLLGKGPPGTSSIYYKGWKGAAKTAASGPTIYYIPQKFEVIESSNNAGEIIISLTNEENPDGYAGFTKSIVDGNQILKTTITIYKASKLSVEDLKAVMRHEFGHALGLAHTTAEEDLMHPIIKTPYPYISDCDIDAIKKLYDGKKKSEVVCQK